MDKLQTLKRGTPEYRDHLMMMVISYGKEAIFSQKGIEIGLSLFDKFKRGEAMTRNEMFTAYIVGTEASLVDGRSDSYDISMKIKNAVFEKYNPDSLFLHAYLYNKLGGEGFIKTNPNFIEGVYSFLPTENL